MMSRLAAGVVGLTALGALIALGLNSSSPQPHGTELLGTWEVPHGIGIDKEPWSAPKNLWLYWGSTTNRRFTGSGEQIRHIFKMGNIEGGEYRDPRFLRSLDGSLFDGMSHKCCTTLLFPPMEWDFPVKNPSKIFGQHVREYVANGNSMIFTGGIMDFQFINRYFYYGLEEADGNYAPGPFPLLPRFKGLDSKQSEMLNSGPHILPQKGISVTTLKKESLPQGSTIIYGSPKTTPVFLIKFCMAENPMNDDSVTLPPVKVLPRDCPASAAAGRPCSCGNICYLGYNYREQYPSRWDTVLKTMVEVCSVQPIENANPENYFPEEKAEGQTLKVSQDSEEEGETRLRGQGLKTQRLRGLQYLEEKQLRKDQQALHSRGHNQGAEHARSGRAEGARGRRSLSRAERTAAQVSKTSSSQVTQKAKPCGAICQLKQLVTKISS